MRFPRQEYWSGLPCLLSGNLPNPEIEPRSPASQAYSLLSEPPGKSKNTRVVAYPFSGGTSWPRNQTGVSCIASRFFTIWVTQKAQLYHQFSLVQLLSWVWLFATPGIVLCHQCCVFPDNLIFLNLYSRFVFHHCFLSISSPHVGLVSCAVIWRYSQMFSPDTVNVCYQ